jgi:hypothetical protein
MQQSRHTLCIKKSFLIKNRAEQIIRLPVGYKLSGEANSFVCDFKELTTVNAQPDNALIEEQTIIQNIPAAYIAFVD